MKPIIFSTPMVQALLNTKPGTWPAEPINPGRPFKSQTRQIVKYKDDFGEEHFIFGMRISPDVEGAYEVANEDTSGVSQDGVAYGWVFPKFKVGDKLWVRETFYDGDMQGKMIYRADGDYDCDGVWKPSIHMPRYAGRLFLEVREVRVERLQDIRHADVIAEGLQKKECGCEVVTGGYCTVFREFWNAINGKGAWESNPWVFVYEFMRVEE